MMPTGAMRTRSAAPPNQRATAAVSCSGLVAALSTGGRGRAAGASNTTLHTPTPAASSRTARVLSRAGAPLATYACATGMSGSLIVVAIRRLLKSSMKISINVYCLHDTQCHHANSVTLCHHDPSCSPSPKPPRLAHAHPAKPGYSEPAARFFPDRSHGGGGHHRHHGGTHRPQSHGPPRSGS